MAGFTAVAKTAEIQAGTAKLIEVSGMRIALFNVEGKFYAIDDTCTHREASLSEGEINGDTITCPLHNATFDFKTGQGTLPAREAVQTYKVQVEGTDIKIELP